ncbi:MAG TPA: ubiquinol-cytochrome C chaperone family protein [Dongiaceae bacterium]|nr:ubiquinol-cytochrome C chaperone family protein [Dongiaceae bacterium]
MLFLKRLFQTHRFQSEGRALYRQIAERARRPLLFTAYGVPDTIDGRFEMLCLHAYAVFHGLKGKGADADVLAQVVYDAMFADLDGSLRELGVADLGVGKRIKTMTEALNGRIQAFDAAADSAALTEAVRRNVYGTATPAEAQVRAMTKYLQQMRTALAAVAFKDLCAARFVWPEPAEPMLETTNAAS